MAELTELGKNACVAKYILQKLTTEEKNKALDTAANYLCDRQAEILAANESDLENGRRNGMNPGLLDRLKLTSDRIAQIAEGLHQISELP
ncbi:gamma-glutamyl-phosphate reductase, partial [Muribaculaceae bacterium Isolate-002 (NCI)]